MSSYQIHYLNRQKALACLMIAQCASDSDARDLADLAFRHHPPDIRDLAGRYAGL